MSIHGSGWLADIKRESEANASRRLAPVVVRYCDVCEEPAPALTAARYHAGVRLCADCLVSELDVVDSLDAYDLTGEHGPQEDA